jgi:GNAT superfamily N-acetyltransferase
VHASCGFRVDIRVDFLFLEREIDRVATDAQQETGAVNPIVRILVADDAAVLDRVAPGVFDHPVDPRWTAEFLADLRHHLAVAIDRDLVVGMASAVHYVHPDKPPELWVNEVAVAPTHRGRGIGRRLLEVLFEHGRALGCGQAWVATEPGNTAARRLYASVGGQEAPEPFVMVEFPLLPRA